MTKIINYQPEKRKQVETKSNQIFKKVDVIESSSKSQNIQFDESIKSPILKKREKYQLIKTILNKKGKRRNYQQCY